MLTGFSCDAFGQITRAPRGITDFTRVGDLGRHHRDTTGFGGVTAIVVDWLNRENLCRAFRS